MDYAPSKIVQHYLIQLDPDTFFDPDQAIGSPGIGPALPPGWDLINPVGGGGRWPVFSPSMPIDGDYAVSIGDTSAVMDGRLMSSGDSIDHPGLQFKVRSADPISGYALAKRLQNVIKDVKMVTVDFTDAHYKIHAISRKSGIIPLGEEKERQRYVWTLNATITFTEITP